MEIKNSLEKEHILEREAVTPELLQAKFLEYKEKFPQVMQIWEIAGIHPRKQAPMLNPYTDELDPEDFSNIGWHCISVAYCAESIVQALLRENKISLEESNLILEKCLVHDANKRFEVFRKKAQKAGKINEVYTEKAYQTMLQKLKQSGIEDEEILEYITVAGKETGHNSLGNFMRVRQDGTEYLDPNFSLSEMIIHLADNMVHSPLPGSEETDTFFVKFIDRAQLSKFFEKYPFLYEEGFGFDLEGAVVFLKNIAEIHNQIEEITKPLFAKEYIEWQQLASFLIARHLQSLISSSCSHDPEEFAVNLVNKAIKIDKYLKKFQCLKP